MTSRPAFRTNKATSAAATPEELFNKLPNRGRTHGYLRQPQADVLRQYHAISKTRDIALELPTGTGKTVVGLLIAEWRRRMENAPVAFLTVTNQLARQVVKEAQKLGIECADLTGTKESRDPVAVGRYKTGQAIGVTTYANLFNVNPVILPSEVLIFDDAHGGEQVAADMWTVRVDPKRDLQTYLELLNALRPALSDAQFRVITDASTYNSVELADLRGHERAVAELTHILDGVSTAQIRFPWGEIRNNLSACLVLVSSREISIRPLVPPTHTHPPFSETKQRIYLSATLGGEGDLQRGYGIDDVKSVRAEHAQWGKRYVFMPELHLDDASAWKCVASVWDSVEPKRALLLAPSGSALDTAFEHLSNGARTKPARFGKKDIEDSLDGFVASENTVLGLAGRYDGIDLPGDDCRLLVMVDSPAAVNPLERHLREHWKLGPVLRRRERTRLIQGMGRCTRDATDYAVIFLMGQSLVDGITSPGMRRLLPGEIQREVTWGIDQGEVSAESPTALADMAIGLLQDPDYRSGANESVSDIEVPAEASDLLSKDNFGRWEVEFARSLWANNLTRALEVASQASDAAGGADLVGYRAWWLYLSSVAAHSLGDSESEIDSLTRARATGINAGFLDGFLRGTPRVPPEAELYDVEAEAVWQRIDELGWHGPHFGKLLEKMNHQLNRWDESTTFHMGVETLGRFLGADVLRPTDDGAPDVVWIFSDIVYTFEAKASSTLSKKYALQAMGHPDWVRAHHPGLKDAPFQALVVSPTLTVDPLAAPHATYLNHLSIDSLRHFGAEATKQLQALRTRFLGKDYGDAREAFKSALKRAGIDRTATDALLAIPALK